MEIMGNQSAFVSEDYLKCDTIGAELSLLLVKWDDVIGPRLVQAFSKIKDDELNDLSYQLYNALSCAAGYTTIFPDPIDIIIPVINYNTKAYIFFDSYKDASARSGNRTFMIALISKYIHYNDVSILRKKFLGISRMFKNQRDILEHHFDDICNAISSN